MVHSVAEIIRRLAKAAGLGMFRRRTTGAYGAIGAGRALYVPADRGARAVDYFPRGKKPLFQHVHFRLFQQHAGSHMPLPVDGKGAAPRFTAKAGGRLAHSSVLFHFGQHKADILIHVLHGLYGWEQTKSCLCKLLRAEPSVKRERMKAFPTGGHHVGFGHHR